MGGRDGNQVRSEQGSHNGINGKAILRDDHVRGGSGVISGKQCVSGKFDDFVRAGAEDEIGRFDAEFCGQLLL